MPDLKFALALAAAGAIVLAFLATANGASTNRYTHCDAEFVTCASNCNPDGGFIAVTEDDPCWFIQSPDSDWHKPVLSLRVKDYRP